MRLIDADELKERMEIAPMYAVDMYVACAEIDQSPTIKGEQVTTELRELFIKRMTVDSPHHDRRRKDFNQAIFHWWEEDEAEADPSKTFPCWSSMDMAMVLQCFDNAVKDWRRSWCDVENCARRD